MNDTTDWYDIAPVTERSVMVSEAAEIVPSNVFVLFGERRILLVDTGFGVGDLRGLISAEFHDYSTVQVVLTHSHWDHIGNAHQFDDILIHPRERTPDGEVTIDVLSDEFVDRPRQFVRTRTETGEPFPDSFDADSFDVPPAEGVGAIEPEDTIDLGDRTLEVVGLPGHSPGQIGLLDSTDGVLYGGDVIHKEQNCFIHFQDSSMIDHAESLATVIELRDTGRFDTLATGHNSPLSGKDLSILDEMYDTVRSVLDGTPEYERIETDWGPARQYDVGDSVLLSSP